MRHNNTRGINPSCGVALHERLPLINNTQMVVSRGLIRALTCSDDDGTTRSIRRVPVVLEMLLYYGI